MQKHQRELFIDYINNDPAFVCVLASTSHRPVKLTLKSCRIKMRHTPLISLRPTLRMIARKRMRRATCVNDEWSGSCSDAAEDGPSLVDRKRQVEADQRFIKYLTCKPLILRAPICISKGCNYSQRICINSHINTRIPAFGLVML